LLERSGGGPGQPVGRVVVVDDDLAGYGFSNFVQLLRVDSCAICPDFVGWWLYRLHASGVVERLQHQTTQMRNLDWRDYRRLLLPLPPRDEQRLIVDRFRAHEVATRRAAAALDAATRVRSAIVQDRTRDRELADPRRPLGLRDLPTDWRRYSLRRLVREHKLGTDDVAEHGATSIAMVKMAALGFGTLDVDALEYVSERKAQLLDDYRLRDRDFLFNTRNTPDLVGKSVMWRAEHPRAVFNNNILRLRFDEAVVLPEYVELEFSSWRGRRRAKSLAVGTTSVAAIYWQALRRCELPIPPMPYQRQAVAAVSAAREAEACAAARLNALRRVGAALLQTAFTDVTSVSEKEMV
jgi:type I restriction enzyme S subunit